MMHKIFFITIIVLLSSLLFSQDLTGDLYGRVFDFTTKQPIPFANVIVLETNFGAATNEDGYFQINGLPLNTYQIRSSVVGFNPQIKTDVVIQSGKPYTPFKFDGTQNIADYNTRRIKSTHSLDVRVDKRWYFSGWTLITYLDIQNIYNQKNQSGIRWDSREMKTIESSSIGILPSIGISAEF